jgi:GTP-binding protein Era
MSFRAGYAALVGRPNVGKSTLLNRLIGQKLAITSHKPQTTRHSILGIQSRDDGQIVYVDTPGIHQRGSKALNRYLNRTAQTVLSDVDVLLFVVQAGQWTEEDDAVLKAITRTGTPVIAVVNKVDTIKQKDQLLPYLAELNGRHTFHAVLPVSAKQGSNCAALENEVLALLPEGEAIFPEDQLSDRPGRFFAAELIREQLIRRYHKELPYATSVGIEKFEEKPNAIVIHAVIWVERDSQRGILIGKQGEALKAAGTAARKALEKFFDTKVHLQLWVKVKTSWSADETTLQQLGYGD